MWDGRNGWYDGNGDVVHSFLEISAEFGDGDDVPGEMVAEAAEAEVGKGEDAVVEVGTAEGVEVWRSFRSDSLVFDLGFRTEKSGCVGERGEG